MENPIKTPGLVLARRENQRIIIDGGTIVITVITCQSDKVRLHIKAPGHVRIDREEVFSARKAKGCKDGGRLLPDSHEPIKEKNIL